MQAQDLDPRPRPASLRKSAVLVASVLVIGAGLTSWKYSSLRAAEAAGAHPMEPAEVVTTAPAVQRPHSATTTAIGTVHALRSVTLRNEVAGTVRIARLTPGQIVEPGTVLVALDVSVEEASLRALQAQAQLAGTVLDLTRRQAGTAEPLVRGGGAGEQLLAPGEGRRQHGGDDDREDHQRDPEDHREQLEQADLVGLGPPLRHLGMSGRRQQQRQRSGQQQRT